MSLTSEDISTLQTMMESLFHQELMSIRTDVPEPRKDCNCPEKEIDLHEICKYAYDEFHKISYRLQSNNQCLVDLRLDINILKDAVCEELYSLNHKIDTLIKVLREKEFPSQ